MFDWFYGERENEAEEMMTAAAVAAQWEGQLSLPTQRALYSCCPFDGTFSFACYCDAAERRSRH